jgi:hypothetical protein
LASVAKLSDTGPPARLKLCAIFSLLFLMNVHLRISVVISALLTGNWSGRVLADCTESFSSTVLLATKFHCHFVEYTNNVGQIENYNYNSIS